MKATKPLLLEINEYIDKISAMQRIKMTKYWPNER